MQVINGDGYVIGKVKDMYLIVGETDQAALLIENDEGNEIEIKMSEVSAVGDVVLLKPKEKAKTGRQTVTTHCPSCGAVLDPEAVFCPECGTKVR